MRASDVGLTDYEYERVLVLMGRIPNDLELGLFGALWSEHCSYKNSKSLLAQLPHGGEAVVEGPGGNAGVVRLSDEVEVAFKVESHNHPSYVEPVQGAATGVGGILRDIIAMGARPIAVADALRFGTDANSMRLLTGVVKGIGQYGNAIGIPTVTGDIGFSSTYRDNPLVNVLAVGIRHPHQRIGAATAQPGQLMVLIGQRTGRDGIHGASLLASQDFSSDSADLRPTVQVGDPFLGKLLMEATLAAVDAHILGALQDLGAAGLSSAVAELCHSSEVGARLWLDRVPLREIGLSPYDIMLSETQERMLMAVSDQHIKSLADICEHYDIALTVIGSVTEARRLELYFNDQIVADVAPEWLVEEAPRRVLDPKWWDALSHPVSTPQIEIPKFSVALLLKVLSDLDVRDRASVYRQYDSMIQTNTVLGPGHDAAVLRIRRETAGLAVAVAGPGRWSSRDAYSGGAGAVFRVLASIAAQGATTLGLTDGINAGNPDKPDSFHAMAALVRGIADAARAAVVPVTGGNVSLHNETQGQAILPTVVIGGVGRHPNPLNPLDDRFTRAGQRLLLINAGILDWGGSVAARVSGIDVPYPRPDLERVRLVLEAVRTWVESQAPVAIRVVGDGGLGGTLTRLMAASDHQLGIEVMLSEDTPQEKTLRFYNEVSLQWLAVVENDACEKARDYWNEREIRMDKIGTVTETGLLVVDGKYQWSRSDLLAAWRTPYREVDS